MFTFSMHFHSESGMILWADEIWQQYLNNILSFLEQFHYTLSAILSNNKFFLGIKIKTPPRNQKKFVSLPTTALGGNPTMVALGLHVRVAVDLCGKWNVPIQHDDQYKSTTFSSKSAITEHVIRSKGHQIDRDNVWVLEWESKEFSGRNLEAIHTSETKTVLQQRSELRSYMFGATFYIYIIFLQCIVTHILLFIVTNLHILSSPTFCKCS